MKSIHVYAVLFAEQASEVPSVNNSTRTSVLVIYLENCLARHGHRKQYPLAAVCRVLEAMCFGEVEDKRADGHSNLLRCLPTPSPVVLTRP